MRIGVVCEREKNARCALEIAKIGEFRAVEIYMAEIKKTYSKRRFLRRIRKCAKIFSEIGITVCAAEAGLEALGSFGITAVIDGNPLLMEMCGDMALLFAEKHNAPNEFVITGGSFSNVVEAAKRLLSVCRCVYVKNNAFCEIAEEIAEQTGVSIRQDAPEGIPELCMCNGQAFLHYGQCQADLADFRIKLSDELLNSLPEKIIEPLALILKKSGFLQKKEIKVEIKIQN